MKNFLVLLLPFVTFATISVPFNLSSKAEGTGATTDTSDVYSKINEGTAHKIETLEEKTTYFLGVAVGNFTYLFNGTESSYLKVPNNGSANNYSIDLQNIYQNFQTLFLSYSYLDGIPLLENLVLDYITVDPTAYTMIYSSTNNISKITNNGSDFAIYSSYLSVERQAKLVIDSSSSQIYFSFSSDIVDSNTIKTYSTFSFYQVYENNFRVLENKITTDVASSTVEEFSVYQGLYQNLPSIERQRFYTSESEAVTKYKSLAASAGELYPFASATPKLHYDYKTKRLSNLIYNEDYIIYCQKNYYNPSIHPSQTNKYELDENNNIIVMSDWIGQYIQVTVSSPYVDITSKIWTIQIKPENPAIPPDIEIKQVYDDSIVIAEMDSIEFSLDNNSFIYSGYFSDLTPETTYTIYWRYPETTQYNPSITRSKEIKTLSLLEGNRIKCNELIDSAVMEYTIKDYTCTHIIEMKEVLSKRVKEETDGTKLKALSSQIFIYFEFAAIKDKTFLNIEATILNSSSQETLDSAAIAKQKIDEVNYDDYLVSSPDSDAVANFSNKIDEIYNAYVQDFNIDQYKDSILKELCDFLNSCLSEAEDDKIKTSLWDIFKKAFKEIKASNEIIEIDSLNTKYKEEMSSLFKAL